MIYTYILYIHSNIYMFISQLLYYQIYFTEMWEPSVFCDSLTLVEFKTSWLQWPLSVKAIQNIKPLIFTCHAWEQSYSLRLKSTFIALL